MLICFGEKQNTRKKKLFTAQVVQPGLEVGVGGREGRRGTSPAAASASGQGSRGLGRDAGSSNGTAGLRKARQLVSQLEAELVENLRHDRVTVQVEEKNMAFKENREI